MMKKISKKKMLVGLISIVIILVLVGLVIGINIIRSNIASNSYVSANSNSNNGNLLPEYIKKGITLGGVTGTLEELNTSDATAKPEDILWGKTAYVNGEKITGTKVKPKVGDYVDYNPDGASEYTGLTEATTGSTSNSSSYKSEELKWRILSINDDGTVDLISEIPTSQPIYFKGVTGYNNAVYLLNDLAKSLYSDNRLGVTARSLTIEDVEACMNETGLNSVHNYTTSSGIKWGQQKTYTNSYRYYPTLYARENGSGINTQTVKTDGIGQSDSYYNTATTETYTQASSYLTVTQTEYYIRSNSSQYKNEAVYNVLYSGGSGSFWLASRCVNNNSNSATFEMRIMSGNSNYISSNPLFEANNRELDSFGQLLRPVVTLRAEIKMYGGDGSTEYPYQLST